MKILAASDIHGDKTIISRLVKKSLESDIIILTGDISNCDMSTEKVIKELKKSKKPILAVHGNHELETEIKSGRQVINLHKKVKTIGNYNFVGYGGGGFSQRDKEFEKFASKIKKENIVLITHAPPYDTRLDYLPQTGHVGSRSIKEFKKKHKPLLVICGHLHENEAKKQKIKSTMLVNPGPKGEIIEI